MQFIDYFDLFKLRLIRQIISNIIEAAIIEVTALAASAAVGAFVAHA